MPPHDLRALRKSQAISVRTMKRIAHASKSAMLSMKLLTSRSDAKIANRKAIAPRAAIMTSSAASQSLS